MIDRIRAARIRSTSTDRTSHTS